MDSLVNDISVSVVKEVNNLENKETQSNLNEPEKKRTKTTTSEIWKYFTKIGAKDGVEMARCNGCKQEFKAGGKSHGTFSLRRHVEKCSLIKHEDLGQVMLDMHGKLKNKIDQTVFRQLIAAALIEHDLPYSFVEYRGIREVFEYLNGDAIPISRNTAMADVVKVHLREKAIIKNTLLSIPNRICLTSDLWTTCTTEGYIVLTAHFVDSNWKLNSKILNFTHMGSPHTGFAISSKIYEFLCEWGIEKKIFSLTLDNASANDNMQEHLKRTLNMQNWLLCGGEFFHVRCSAHILNLIVQDGLKEGSDALHKIRESVKYVRGSESRKIKFKECVAMVGGVDTNAGLCLDVPTRWNSTYLMVDVALKYQRVFANFQLKDNGYKDCPSIEEWKRVEKIHEFLEPFYEITNLFSGSTYLTSNLYFVNVWNIQRVLQENSSSEDEVIRGMGERMLVKFNKYWDEYSIILALGGVLDPRMKFGSLEFCFHKVDPSTTQEKLEKVRTKLYMLFKEYSSDSNNSPSSIVQGGTPHSQSSNTSDRSRKQRGLNELKMHMHQNTIKSGKNQLDVYLEEATLQWEHFEDLDVLGWWKDSQKRYPELSIMARDVLSIPITTVASESAFSIGSRVLNKYRSRLLPDNVQALICTRNWLNGYDCHGDDDVEDMATTFSSRSRSGSNVVDLRE